MTATERQMREALEIDEGKYDRLLNSKKEYGANCVVRQSVVWRDTIIDDVDDTDTDRENDRVMTTRMTGQTEEGQDLFSKQYAQRRKMNRDKGPVTSPTTSSHKRHREIDDSVDDNLSRRPNSIAKHFVRK